LRLKEGFDARVSEFLVRHLRAAINDSIDPKVFLMGTYSKSAIESTLPNLIKAYRILAQDE